MILFGLIHVLLALSRVRFLIQNQELFRLNLLLVDHLPLLETVTGNSLSFASLLVVDQQYSHFGVFPICREGLLVDLSSDKFKSLRNLSVFLSRVLQISYNVDLTGSYASLCG